MANISKAEREKRLSDGGAAETVPMHRNPEQWPGPHTANVHPAEVQGWQAHGWRVTEPVTADADR